MIIGIGTDICMVPRIKNTLAKNPRFVDKVFTPDEIAYCEKRAHPAESYAARFAAKEAVMKALGTGWDGVVNWVDIEVYQDALGKPLLRLSNGALARSQQQGVNAMHLSLSHDKDIAIAYVILEKT